METIAMWYEFLAKPGNLPVIAILAVFSVGAVAVVMGTLTQIVKIVVRHRERMAKIEQGIDPDAHPPKSVTP
jgi:hypothetical protein